MVSRATKARRREIKRQKNSQLQQDNPLDPVCSIRITGFSVEFSDQDEERGKNEKRN